MTIYQLDHNNSKSYHATRRQAQKARDAIMEREPKARTSINALTFKLSKCAIIVMLNTAKLVLVLDCFV